MVAGEKVAEVGGSVGLSEIELPESARQRQTIDPEVVRIQTREAAQAMLEEWELANQQRLEQQRVLQEALFLSESDSNQALLELAAQQAREKVMAEFQARQEALGQTGGEISELQRLELEKEIQEQTLANTRDFLNQRLQMEKQFSQSFQNIIALTTKLFGKRWADTHKQTLRNASTFAGAFVQIGQALFGENKALGIANATISTLVGVAKALEMGPIIGPVLAAQVAAQGFAQVQAIRGASVGGASIPAIASGGGVSAVPPAAQPSTQSEADEQQRSQTVVQINIDGGAFVADDERTREFFIDLIGDAVNDRDVVVLNADSRNALEIREG